MNSGWYVAKVFSGINGEAEVIHPGTGTPAQVVEGVHPGGTVILTTSYNLGDMSCLCKWSGTAPADWSAIEASGADGLDNVRAEFLTREGRSPTAGEVC